MCSGGCVVTADKLGVSCVLPVLTCWVELCADHICIRALGTVGSEVHAHYTNLKRVCSHVFTMIIKYLMEYNSCNCFMYCSETAKTIK